MMQDVGFLGQLLKSTVNGVFGLDPLLLDPQLVHGDENSESQGQGPDAAVWLSAAQMTDAGQSFGVSHGAGELTAYGVPQELTAEGITFAGPTDGQWHLESLTGGFDINVVPVWTDYTGAGVTVGVVDEGVQYTHPEFASNYDATIDWDFVLGNNDGGAKLSSDDHGTAVAGNIGAANDGVGTTGVAYGSTITSFRLLGGGSINSVQLDGALSQDVDVSNNSWGWTKPFSAPFFTSVTEGAFEDGATNNRGGLGTIYVFSAGNEGDNNDNVNYHEMQNSRFTIAVAATNEDGTQASFSTPGAPVLVSAPGTSIYTTDLMGAGGYSGTNYATVQGTSFSAPIVSGVVALMLEANPNLGWRDVQNILSMSAVQNDAGNASWFTNGANNWNGGGMHFSNDFGFGVVDARVATRLAESWLLIDTEADVSSNELSQARNLALAPSDPDYAFSHTDPVDFDFIVPQDQSIRLEHIELRLDLAHSRQQDLVITLTSPDGTQSVLFNRPSFSNAYGAIETNYDNTWTLSSNAFRGESQWGTWNLSIQDQVAGVDGILTGVYFTAYGSTYAPNGNSTYYFTDEYSNYAADPTRNKPGSWTPTTINAAAVSTDSTINLTPYTTSTIDGSGFSLIAGAGYNGAYPLNAIGGDGNDTITGNLQNNILYGGRGNDTLDGGLGVDTMYGGEGDDIYFVDSLSDVVVENAGEGNDIIYSSLASYVLSANVEQLQIVGGGGNVTGTNGDDTISGNALDNTILGMDGNDIISGNDGNDFLIGGDGNDVLNGGTGNDTMQGGLGDDIFIVDSASDVVSENPGEGLDTVRSTITFTLGNGMDRLELLGGANINGTGNGGANDLIGNSAGNVLDGGAGNDYLYGGGGSDTMIGGSGNDIYAVDETTDVITEAAGPGGGYDRVYSVASDYTLSANIEILEMAGTGNYNGTGNALGNMIGGNSGSNILDGGAGNDLINGRGGGDILRGGLGDDRIIINDATDVAVELAGQGTADEIQSTIANYLMPDHFERMLLLGTGDINGFGNAGNNFMQGNLGDNIINGGAGNDFLNGVQGTDTLHGGLGDDIMFLWTATDVAIENAGEGNDTVRSQSTTTLGANIENLQLWFHYNINGTGNELNNSIIGNIGSNTLSGMGGNDLLDGLAAVNTLIGGTGNDTYVVRSVNDTVVENAGEGSDMVRTLVDYTLGDNVENMTLVSGDIDGTGNALNNTMTGSDGDNTMSGLDGVDVLNGLDGADVLNGGNGNDTLIGGLGNDTLNGDDGSDTYLAFTGSFGNDIIADTSGNDILNLTQYNLADIVSWTAVDSGADTFVDQLLLSFSGGNSIAINDYFDNTNASDDLSGAGAGEIESIVFADQTADFADVQALA